MRITVLGSGSGVAVSDRGASAYVIETGDALYLMDTGDGVARQVVRSAVDHERIRCVFISHTHPDHAAGLFSLLQLMHLTGRKKSLRIFLPRGVIPRFGSVFPCFQIFREKWPFRFEILPIVEGVIFDEEGFRLSAISNGHLTGNREYAEGAGLGVDSYSFRVEEEKTGGVVYTSDVDALDHLRPYGASVRVLLSECVHVGVEEVIDFARSVGIPRVVFTHIPLTLEGRFLDGMRTPDDLTVEMAEDGYVIEV